MTNPEGAIFADALTELSIQSYTGPSPGYLA